MQTLQLDSRSVFGTSGSGNQTKIWIGRRHLVKVNSKFREATKEVDAYKLATAFGLNCAKYSEIDVFLHGSNRKACITESFIHDDEVEITVAEILDTYNIHIPMAMSAIDYIKTTAEAIHSFTQLDLNDIYNWIYDMLIFDYIICNDDRHLTNFEVLYSENNKSFRLAPYYDHGQSFFNTDAMLSKSDYEKYERKFKSKPFSSNPDKNIGEHIKAIESLNRMLTNVGGIDGVKQLGLNSGHKATVIRRIQRLKKILSIA